MITDVQVWGRVLKEEEMIGYTACTGKGLKGDIASWEEEEWWEVKGKVTSSQMRYFPNGSINFYSVRKSDICSATGVQGGERMLLPPRLSWERGRQLCRR